MRLFESLHGHAGILAVAALLHPALLLRKGWPLTRGTKLAVLLSTGFAVVAFASGVSIYEGYRATVKRPLFAVAPDAGWLFETKEHLAFVVVCFALGAGIAAVSAPRDAIAHRRAASRLYAAAALLALVVAGIGTYVASIRGF